MTGGWVNASAPRLALERTGSPTLANQANVNNQAATMVNTKIAGGEFLNGHTILDRRSEFTPTTTSAGLRLLNRKITVTGGSKIVVRYNGVAATLVLDTVALTLAGMSFVDGNVELTANRQSLADDSSFVMGTAINWGPPSGSTAYLGTVSSGQYCANKAPAVGQPKGWLRTADAWVSTGNL